MQDKFTVFGGNQPHECIGKHVALVELQLFARILCREYNFQAGILFLYIVPLSGVIVKILVILILVIVAIRVQGNNSNSQ